MDWGPRRLTINNVLNEIILYKFQVLFLADFLPTLMKYRPTKKYKFYLQNNDPTGNRVGGAWGGGGIQFKIKRDVIKQSQSGRSY